MNIKTIRTAIALLNSMVKCGEAHSEGSRKVVQKAIEDLNTLEQEAEKIPKVCRRWNQQVIWDRMNTEVKEYIMHREYSNSCDIRCGKHDKSNCPQICPKIGYREVQE